MTVGKIATVIVVLVGASVVIGLGILASKIPEEMVPVPEPAPHEPPPPSTMM